MNIHKKIYTCLLVAGSIMGWGQVGIGTNSPQGILDVHSTDGTNVMGLVLPKVSGADAIPITGTPIPAGVPNPAPSVTTPKAAYQSFQTTQTIEGQTVTTDWSVPLEEALEGTLVYDNALKCVRIKQTATLGDWSGCLVDSTSVSEEINNRLYGGTVFQMKKASAGYLYSLAIDTQDELYVAGYTLAFTSGNGQYSTRSSWTKVFDQKVKNIAAGFYHAAAVTTDGKLYVWGYNAFGQLGTSNTQVYLQTPTLATFFANDPVKDVKANFYNLLVLTESGKVYMTGWDGFRLKGDGTTTDAGYIQEFRQVPFPTGVNVQSISLGFSAAAALDSNGNAYTWGYNYEYATGQGINTLYTYAPTIINPDGIKFEKAEIAASGLAVVEGGKDLYAWGVRRNVGMEVTAYDTRPTLRTSTLGLAQDETIVNINIGSAIPVEVPYLHPSFVITDKRVLTSGYNFYGRSGVVEPGGAIRYELNGNTSGNNSFYEIQGHAIYEGTQFLGATVGYFHTILWTGTNALNAAYNYTGYGTSGLSDWYMSDGGGSHTSVFTKIIE